MMINSIHTMTAQRPSFGVSAYGLTSLERVAVPAATGVQVSTWARARLIGDMALATTGDFPGTSAWRPPIC